MENQNRIQCAASQCIFNGGYFGECKIETPEFIKKLTPAKEDNEPITCACYAEDEL